jgi:hypothetical protein
MRLVVDGQYMESPRKLLMNHLKLLSHSRGTDEISQ